MQTMFCGDKFGFLALTISLKVYATLSPTSFIKHANPDPAPSIPTNTTVIEQSAIRYTFTLDTEL